MCDKINNEYVIYMLFIGGIVCNVTCDQLTSTCFIILAKAMKQEIPVIVFLVNFRSPSHQCPPRSERARMLFSRVQPMTGQICETVG